MGRIIYIVLGLLTAIVGKSIHGSLFWAVVNFFFWWISWFKWLICEEVNISIIEDSFAFFLK